MVLKPALNHIDNLGVKPMFTKLRILSAAIAMFIASTASADLVIIGHPDYKTGDLDIQSVKKLFLGERKSFPNGLNAKPINHVAGSPDRKEFFTTVSLHGLKIVMKTIRKNLQSGKQQAKRVQANPAGHQEEPLSLDAL